jgi:hypothetical protein
MLTGAIVTWFVTGFPDLTTEGEVPYGSSNRRRLHDRERRIVAVYVQGRVDQLRIVPVPLADRVLAPGIEGLLGKAQHPAGHRDRNTAGGKVKDQRVRHFGEISRAK